MKQRDFERRFEPLWLQLENWLAGYEKHKLADRRNNATSTKQAAAISDLPSSYRHLCQHLAVAKERQYTSNLIARLNQLVMACHQRLYQQKSVSQNRWLEFLFRGFPRALRQHGRFVWLACGLFLAPALVMGLGCYWNDALIYAVMSPEQVLQIESMYDPANRVLGRERGSDSDLLMFGFYIKNNIGIAFRTFASGILFGLGSIFFLVFNGVFLGAVFGHITRVGFVTTFYPFVIGHGAFELTAIVFAGAAGLMLGHSLVNPGNRSRRQSLREAGRESMKIMYGTFLMLVIAAFLEAFWSSTTQVDIAIKFIVGAALWALVIGYCLLAGRAPAQMAVSDSTGGRP
ncbi:stage II sporulation protein M [Microbulbifer bruguierae]|uniref:Stage II sporulation protein M n=1 Tax=Microbulbifer bruguierae TaxID=3029061 RepID=A0ABY8N9N1_9GAMM|nr:stage II sporulation protein M [Microbulbifer bruguierae]WGL15591.1 stage II sporulation protein M [Microbulbifer bruguierae]